MGIVRGTTNYNRAFAYDHMSQLSNSHHFGAQLKSIEAVHKNGHCFHGKKACKHSIESP